MAPGDLTSNPPGSPSAWPSRLKLTIRVVVAGLVAWGIWYTVAKALRALRREDLSLAEVVDFDARWLLAAAGVYLAGLAPACWFWWRVLWAMGQRPSGWSLVRAYFIGHLGKYVPGKAMVVVLRTGLIRGPRVDTTVAAVSVFVETLTMMAVGAGVASVFLAVLYREHASLLALGTGMTLAAGVPTIPPIFRGLVRALKVKRLNPEIEQALAGIDWRLTASGWLSMTLGWCLMALSLACVLASIPGVSIEARHAPLILSTVSLAMVAGFLSLIPGGLGVRELVVIPLLAPVFGHVPALLSAVLLRLIWLLAELAASGILYAAKERSPHVTTVGRREGRPTNARKES